ncbi:hypothetical protein ACSZME_13720 [Aeromonas dhakensis]|uniref:hypothetical protein n=1 Tax=Aeromonas dhakensis TaxID=196024 RepID=UPI003985D016
MRISFLGAYYCLWLISAFIMPLSLLSAAEINVTAEYKPALYEPSQAIFTSTTTPCAPLPEGAVLTQVCDGSNIWGPSMVTVSIPLGSITRSTLGAQNDPKDAFFYLKVPPVKTFNVKSSSGQVFPVTFTPRRLGSVYLGDWPSSFASTVYNELRRNTVVGPCSYAQSSATGGLQWYRIQMFHNTPQPGSTCYNSTVQTSTLNVRHTGIYFSFLMNMPNPLSMPNGVYTGALILTIGPGDADDISLGNGEYSDRQVTVNVTLTVRHQIKVDFPAGYENLALKPPSGWGEWLNGGRVPSILKESLPFDIAASSLFRVSYLCQYAIGEQCALKNTRNEHMVGLDMYYLIDPSTRYKLPVSILPTGTPSVRKQVISFEVPSDNVKAMVQYPGSTYTGVVTLIFDALP